LPDAGTSVHFVLTRASGEKNEVISEQNWQLSSYITENVTVTAVLKGTDKVSPTLFPHGVLVSGSMRASGTYVSRAFDIGTAVRISTYLKVQLPAGSSVSMSYDKVDGTYIGIPSVASDPLNFGWTDNEFRLNSITTPKGRLLVQLSGTPAARPTISDLSAVLI
jgi:hypothetical protein